jgi:hypothetical protein
MHFWSVICFRKKYGRDFVQKYLVASNVGKGSRAVILQHNCLSTASGSLAATHSQFFAIYQNERQVLSEAAPPIVLMPL